MTRCDSMRSDGSAYPLDVVERSEQAWPALPRQRVQLLMSGATRYRHEEAFRRGDPRRGHPAAHRVLIRHAGGACVVDRQLLPVLIVELLNSSVEAAVDRAGLDTHHLAKRAKDIGSAAVFLALILLGTTWFLIAGPMLLALVQNSR